MLLKDIKVESKVCIHGLVGNKEDNIKAARLGFCQGTVIEVLKNDSNGVLVRIRGDMLALNHKLSSIIKVQSL